MTETVVDIPSTDEIIRKISASISIDNRKVQINYDSLVSEKNYSELPSEPILTAFVKSIDRNFPGLSSYDAGALLEVLLTCTFLHDSEKNSILIQKNPEAKKKSGSFYTPKTIVSYLTSRAIELTLPNSPFPLILDPACGAGFFLIEALNVLSYIHPNFSLDELAQRCLRGIDFHPAAIQLSNRILVQDYAISRQIVALADSLADFVSLRIKPETFDIVIGNPPYLNLSGKSSPVAKLRRAGLENEARNLQREILEKKKRFAATSHGNIDYYKWFIERTTDFVRDGGIVALVTPNTWLNYSRFSDVRELLVNRGELIEVLDFGFAPFSDANVPVCTFIWRKNTTQKNRISSYHKSRLEKITEAAHRAVIEEYNPRLRLIFPENSGFHSKEYPPHYLPLSEFVTLREGSHTIKSVPINTPTVKSDNCDFPVVIDKTISSLAPPKIGYIPQTIISESVQLHHSGDRFFIRKTGDSLIVAPSSTESFALAHQNVYVGKVIEDKIDFYALLGILASSHLTELYRSGSGGQKGRIHAQLRIHFLRELPIVVVPDFLRRKIDPEKIDDVFTKILNDDFSEIPVIPLVISDDSVLAQNIELIHGLISLTVQKIIIGGEKSLFAVLDNLVYHLYGIDNK